MNKKYRIIIDDEKEPLNKEQVETIASYLRNIIKKQYIKPLRLQIESLS